MFAPKYPPTDTAHYTTPATQPTAPTAPVVPAQPIPAPVAQSTRPVVQFTPGSTALLIAGGTAAVLVVGVVLVSMLLAVAITAVSVAVVAVVLRSLVTDSRKSR